MTKMSKLFAVATICGTILIGAPSATTFAAVPTLETASDAQATVIQLSAWPRIRDALLGRNRDYRPAPPPPHFRHCHPHHHRIAPPPHPRPHHRPGHHFRHASFVPDNIPANGVTTEQPPMV